MNPGKLDRRITLQALTKTRGTEGGFVETWAEVTTLWGEVLQPSAGVEARQAETDRSNIRRQFRIRYYPGISETTHRVVYDSQIYNLIHASEEGRKAYHLLTCEFTEGRV